MPCVALLHADTCNLHASCLPLVNPDTSLLEKLSDACQKATFGLNKKDVLDESYRKAGKMDINNFAINFNPERLNLIKNIRHNLFADDKRDIRAELYKLNVYGMCSFNFPESIRLMCAAFL